MGLIKIFKIKKIHIKDQNYNFKFILPRVLVEEVLMLN